jgi:hypothetical protein
VTFQLDTVLEPPAAENANPLVPSCRRLDREELVPQNVAAERFLDRDQPVTFDPKDGGQDVVVQWLPQLIDGRDLMVEDK